MESKQFDELIRKKLEGIKPPLPAQAWEEMSRQVEQEEGHAFDESMAKGLSDLTAFTPPPQWDKMAEQLDLADAALFDETVQTKLERVSPILTQQEGWLLLSRRLQWLSYLQNRVLQYKIGEFALLLLLLLIFQGGLYQPEKNIVADESMETMDSYASSREFQVSPLDLPRATEKPSQTPPPHILSSASDLIQEDPSPEGARGHSNATDESLGSLASATSASAQADLSTQEEQNLPEVAVPSTAGIAVFPLLPLANPSLPDPELEESLPASSIRKHKTSGFGMALVLSGGSEIFRVLTPFDAAFDEASTSYISAGYSSGLGLQVSRSRLALQTGITYTHVSYSPRQKTEIFDGSLTRGGYFANDLNRISFNFLQIPLQLHYTLARGKKWALSPFIGAQWSVALNAYYDVQTRFVPARASMPPPGPSGENTGYATPDPDKSILQARADNPGILDGGTLVDNDFFSILGGVRFRHQIGGRYAVFGQAAYLHPLSKSGLGPNNDRFQIFSTSIGLVIRM